MSLVHYGWLMIGWLFSIKLPVQLGNCDVTIPVTEPTRVIGDGIWVCFSSANVMTKNTNATQERLDAHLTYIGNAFRD
jgi:hypothetical protein